MEKSAADVSYWEITHLEIQKGRLNGHSACNQNMTNEFAIKGEQKPLWQTGGGTACVASFYSFVLILSIQISLVNKSVKVSTFC